MKWPKRRTGRYFRRAVDASVGASRWIAALQSSERLLECRECDRIFDATSRAFALDDSLEFQDAEADPVNGQLEGVRQLLVERPQAVHMGDDIDTLADRVAPDLRRPRSEGSRDQIPRASLTAASIDESARSANQRSISCVAVFAPCSTAAVAPTTMNRTP